MTEEEAYRIVADLLDRTSVDRLRHLADLVTRENERQNLIAGSTIPHLWQRHILDSVQLLALANDWNLWLDVGTGAGFPGLAIACARPASSVVLVEPRRLRADFLAQAAATLGLSGVEVIDRKIERVERPCDVISARAVASPPVVLRGASRCATSDTVWLLPWGKEQAGSLALLHRQFASMVFHVEQSLSDPTSSVLVGRGVPR